MIIAITTETLRIKGVQTLHSPLSNTLNDISVIFLTNSALRTFKTEFDNVRFHKFLDEREREGYHFLKHKERGQA